MHIRSRAVREGAHQHSRGCKRGNTHLRCELRLGRAIIATLLRLIHLLGLLKILLGRNKSAGLWKGQANQRGKGGVDIGGEGARAGGARRV